ncbi:MULTISPECIES: NUDIX domain-containing protein [Nonomuraea]|uniref:NUDIX domain-containing protein n=2 Tax=Nonomuraea TaxID=83681 RepID=A0ABW1BPA3_9ACTN|nr:MULTISPECIES: NUDIX hydrolase [Nonomuraea]MDA0639409.1 NUDIX hydrolase [Nonomuraea ferruginea]TXK39647.1 NUDIX hydrolase [Nonomuraea sp. C10]
MRDAEAGTIRQLSTKVVYANAWMKVREDEIERPDGSRGTYGYVDKPDFALVIPMERDGFHLVEEYRYPVRRRSWSFPQGSAAEPTPEDVARTELAEETGLRARTWTPLGALDNAHGLATQRLHVYLATGLEAGAAEREHTEQDMRRRWVSRAEFEDMLRAGEVGDSGSVAAYTLLTLHERVTPASG